MHEANDIHTARDDYVDDDYDADNSINNNNDASMLLLNFLVVAFLFFALFFVLAPNQKQQANFAYFSLGAHCAALFRIT